MTISFQCVACEADFEIDIPEVVEHPEQIKCANCGAHPAAHRSHALATALEDLLAAMAGIRKKVRFDLNLATDELPEPYGKVTEAEAVGGLDLEDEDEEEEDEEGDEDEDEDEDEDDDLDEDLDEDEDFDDDDDDDEDFDDEDDEDEDEEDED